MHVDDSLRTNGAAKNPGEGLTVSGGTFHLVFESTTKMNLSMCEWFLLETVLTPYWF